jgi:hypothetical protein
MHLPRGERVPVVLRVPPFRGLRATLQEVGGSAKFPTFAASVELELLEGWIDRVK